MRANPRSIATRVITRATHENPRLSGLSLCSDAGSEWCASDVRPKRNPYKIKVVAWRLYRLNGGEPNPYLVAEDRADAIERLLRARPLIGFGAESPAEYLRC
jgi:hypothetical protein